MRDAIDGVDKPYEGPSAYVHPCSSCSVMSTIIRGSVANHCSVCLFGGGVCTIGLRRLQLMTIRFAALERKGRQVLRSALNGGGFNFNALLWHLGSLLRDKGLWTIGYHAYTGTIR